MCLTLVCLLLDATRAYVHSRHVVLFSSMLYSNLIFSTLLYSNVLYVHSSVVESLPRSIVSRNTQK